MLPSELPGSSEENVQSRAVDEPHAGEVEDERRAACGNTLQTLFELVNVGEIELSREDQHDLQRIAGGTLLELEHAFRRHDPVGTVKFMWSDRFATLGNGGTQGTSVMSDSEPLHALATEFRVDETEHVRGTRAIVLAIHGDTDMHVVDELEARLAEVIDEAPDALVLDLSGVTFLDSMALGVLLSSLKRLRETGGQLRVVAPRPEIRRIFEVTLLDRLFDIDSTRDEALAAATAPV